MHGPKPYEFIGFRWAFISQTLAAMSSKGSRHGCLAKWLFGGLGCRGQKTTHLQENDGLLAWPPKAKHSFPKIVWFVGLGAPGPPKNTWPKKHFVIPLNSNDVSFSELFSGTEWSPTPLPSSLTLRACRGGFRGGDCGPP